MTDRPTIAHIGVAVESIEAALPFYRDVLGLVPGHAEEADGARIVSLHFGASDVELLEPKQADSPIAKFLARRGPGVHHLAFQVDSTGKQLRILAEAGAPVLDQTPRPGAHGTLVGFLHPRYLDGVLAEFVEDPK